MTTYSVPMENLKSATHNQRGARLVVTGWGKKWKHELHPPTPTHKHTRTYRHTRTHHRCKEFPSVIKRIITQFRMRVHAHRSYGVRGEGSLGLFAKTAATR